MAVKSYNAEELYQGILEKNMVALARAITLIESELPSHRQIAADLLKMCSTFSGETYRIGITGVPGAGKSTFIERFGLSLCESGKKVGVIAIDPSSNISKGSILGDKTRMDKLSVHPNAFIRPSPSSGYLGGIHSRSRETIVLLEAAGFEYILIETVGVGQSEIEVKNICDFFLLLMLPGSGDELQGIKRGIMEMADGIVIHKADGSNEKSAIQAMSDFSAALHLFSRSNDNWVPKVVQASSVTGKGLEEVYEMLKEYRQKCSSNNGIINKRIEQNINWLHRMIESRLKADFYTNPLNKTKLEQAEKALRTRNSDVFTLYNELFT